MDKLYLIANWKMNPQTSREARVLFDAVLNIGRMKNIETVICPPFPFLPIFGSPKSLKLGAQDLFWELQGPYTGQVSGKMLRELGCEYVIIGHSERRKFAGESDEIINGKLKAALKCVLAPILCVGEREGEEMGEVLTAQVTGSLKDIGKSELQEIIIVYEPVWAISSGVVGTGKPCLPNDALSASLFIKKIITGLYGRYLADKIPIIYGGSVDAKNAASYISEARMQGVLVGGASLVAEEFSKIADSINNLL
jgi:triosephosphate isomerase